jgi:putative two-component system response regulator
MPPVTHTSAAARTHASIIDAPGRIIVADDMEANLDLLSRLLARDGHEVARARNGDEALALIAREPPDLILLDVMMPGRTGLEVCRLVKADEATRLIPVVLITALQDSQDRIRGIDAGADDFLTKPVNAPELQARVRSLLRLKRHTDDLDSAQSVILSLALTIEARDAYTKGHCQRLAAYATELGAALRLPEPDLAALKLGGVLHDIGKVGVPDAVLLKQGPLTPAEFDLIKQHTVIGDRLCGSLRSLKRVRPIVRHHHEHWDGSGYPDGLRGDHIPLLAHIIGIVDVFDAITTDRPYRAALPVEEACGALAREVARGWRRADLVEAFIALVRDRKLPVEPAG